MAKPRRSLLVRLILWIIGLVVLAAAVLFALNNRGGLVLNFWPGPYAPSFQVFVVLYAALLLGFALGGMIGWLGAGRRRRELRRVRAEAERLRAENDELQARLAASTPRPPVSPQAQRQLVAADS